jgi:hypothetical protein
MALTVVFEAAFEIEFGAEFGRGRKAKLGTVEGINGHLVPQIRIITRPEIIGQGHSSAQDVLENGPRYLFPCSGYVAAVRSLGVMPKIATPGAPEKLG